MSEGSLAEARSHNVRPDVFLRHYREIRDCKTAHHDTGMALARAKKSAKGDGIDLDALKLLEKFADLDTDEAEMQLSHLRQYAAWIELPIGTQLDAFGQHKAPSLAETEKQRAHTARSDGEAAGKAGHERGTNRYGPGTAGYVAWDKGWLKGNKTWLAGQKSLAGDLARNANGRGRGRPRKNGADAPAN
jgi:hypothetical protein